MIYTVFPRFSSLRGGEVFCSATIQAGGGLLDEGTKKSLVGN